TSAHRSLYAAAFGVTQSGNGSQHSGAGNRAGTERDGTLGTSGKTASARCERHAAEDEEGTMAAYMIFTRERMRDEVEYEIYKEQARAAGQGHTVIPHALYGPCEALQGPAMQGL